MTPQQINAKIKQLGIHDVELMLDAQINMWAVVQVFKPSGKILVFGDPKTYETAPTIMWWCKKEDGTPRPPNEQDLHDIVMTVKRAQITFDKGSDWMVDKIEAEEKAKYDENRKRQSERIRSYAPKMKRAIRKELT